MPGPISNDQNWRNNNLTKIKKEKTTSDPIPADNPSSSLPKPAPTPSLHNPNPKCAASPDLPKSPPPVQDMHPKAAPSNLIIADTGCTGHFLTSTAPYTKIRPAGQASQSCSPMSPPSSQAMLPSWTFPSCPKLLAKPTSSRS